jgi:[protein-PII] uridylyltransferase
LLRPQVIDAKRRLAEGREKLKQRHLKGSPGIQVCQAMTDLYQSIVLDIYAAACQELADRSGGEMAENVALVAHGGFGRADIAPYSDVDLMILVEPVWQPRIGPLAERMVRDIFDAGLVLGQSVRTPQQACELAREDATICTSLIEGRLLVGSEALYARYTRRFQQQVRRRAKTLSTAIQRSRDAERRQYGETVYLLEPNVKRSPGALRDIQLLRWLGFAHFGCADPDGLRLQGELDRDDFERLRCAFEFLLHLRNELHFAAGRSADLLDRVEQVRIAEAFGFKPTEGLLAVELFMREYFRRTQGTRSIVSRFIARVDRGPAWRHFLAPLFSHQFERDYQVGPYQIAANARGLRKLNHDLAETLRLADVANAYDKPIAHDTCEAIRAAVAKLPSEITPETARRFLSLLSRPARLGELLRNLHEMGVLERLIPAFTHARSLLQFNVYHKYTVDEHSIRAVEEATRFLHDTGPLGSVYKHLKRKWLLHLALLIHDLGKGHVEDHSIVGMHIAQDVGERLELSDRDTETLKFLVHKHLMMAHLAFRRDTGDNQLVLRFAVEVGSAEVLEMLFVLTAADLAAVGPGVLNAWKVEVLADLFHRTIKHLGGEDPTLDLGTRLAASRSRVLTRLATGDDREWFERQLEAFPAAYLQTTPVEQIVADLKGLREVSPQRVVADGVWQAETGTVEYRVGTYENVTPGIFHKLTGALSGQGLRILSAEINTLADGLVFDRFVVVDPDFTGEPSAGRRQEVARALVTALERSDGKPPQFRRLWTGFDEARRLAVSAVPAQLRVDNGISERYTILDIFAADRMGLLHTISRTLFELGVSVHYAKIGTYLDQVVDVFYVTDEHGHKIDDEERLGEIRDGVLTAIEALERAEAEQSQPRAKR